MSIQMSYSKARSQLASLCDEVTNNNEVVIIKRKGIDDVALISASELVGLLETCHLLRSPANAARLLDAYRQSLKRSETPQTIEQLREEVGIDQE